MLPCEIFALTNNLLTHKHIMCKKNYFCVSKHVYVLLFKFSTLLIASEQEAISL